MIRSQIAISILGPALAAACVVAAAGAVIPQPEDVLKGHGLTVEGGARPTCSPPSRRSNLESTKLSEFSSN